MPQTSTIPVVSFDQFYAALELRRAFADRPVEHLTQSHWRRVWNELGPSVQPLVYLLVGVGLDQKRAATELGRSRGLACHAYTQLRRAIEALVKQDEIMET